MDSIDIPPDSQKRLIHLSRLTLERFVRCQPRQVDPIEDPYLLVSDYGAFVSLHNRKKLRGCVGTCIPTRPLYETVIDMTEAAASRDNRVSPVSENELADIHIDISVLSHLELTLDPLSLEVGRHGLHLVNGDKRGVFLPQVATEYGWDMETFLRQVCLKAELPKNAWKWPETRISSFTALIIEEER